MQELLEAAARETGTSEAAVGDALRILVGYLDETCDAESMKELRVAAPGLAALGPPKAAGKGFLSGFLGGHGALLALPGKLSKVGFGPGQTKKLLPLVLTWLRRHVEPDLWARIEAQLPSVLTGRK